MQKSHADKQPKWRLGRQFSQSGVVHQIYQASILKTEKKKLEILYSHFHLVRTRLTRNFTFTRTKTSGPESNRIDSHTLWIWITRNRLTRNFGLYNCQIFPRRHSFRFFLLCRKITHSMIETEASRAFVASSAGFAVRSYLLYNFLCVSNKFCRICSTSEISGVSNFFFYYIILVSEHTFPGSPELRTNQNWL